MKIKLMGFLIMVMAVMLNSVALAQDTARFKFTEFQSPPKQVTMRTLGKNLETRSGIAVPVLEYRASNGNVIATLDGYAMTNAKNARGFYAGLGISTMLYATKEFGMGATVGWSQELFTPYRKTGKWGVGVTFSVPL